VSLPAVAGVVAGALLAQSSSRPLEVDWTLLEDEAALEYRVEADVVSGRAFSVEAFIGPKGLERLMEGEGDVAPALEGRGAGVGVAPRGLPAEFAALMALADLAQAESSRLESRSETQQDAARLTRSTSLRNTARFSPSAGVECAQLSRGTSLVSRSESSPSARIEALEGFEASESVRERLGLVHEQGAVLWSMGPEAGGYTLRLLLTAEVRGGTSSSWSLLCRSARPIFVREMTGLAWQVRVVDGAWEATVRRVTRPAPAPEKDGPPGAVKSAE
jgi:hypothetical protein